MSIVEETIVALDDTLDFYESDTTNCIYCREDFPVFDKSSDLGYLFCCTDCRDSWLYSRSKGVVNG